MHVWINACGKQDGHHCDSGIWTTFTYDDGHLIYTTDTCVAYLGTSDCLNALHTKCQVQKAFSIIGILSTAYTAGIVFMNFGGKWRTILAANLGMASFGIIVAISLANYFLPLTIKSDCGTGALLDPNVTLGASNWLFAGAIVSSGIGAAVTFFQKPTNRQ